jgi:hypothetical protein
MRGHLLFAARADEVRVPGNARYRRRCVLNASHASA